MPSSRRFLCVMGVRCILGIVWVFHLRVAPVTVPPSVSIDVLLVFGRNKR
jgi:hypothetical protein